MKLFFWLVAFMGTITLSSNAVASPSVSEKDHPTLLYDLGLQGGWIPYQSGFVSGSTGVFEDITRLISKHTGIKFKSVNFPPKRAEKAMLVGLVDFDFICLEWFTNGIDNDKYTVTEPLFDLKEYFITLEENKDAFNEKSSYFNRRIGTIAGYFYLNDDKFTRVDFLNENQLILGLAEDRFNVAILEKETAKHWAKVHGVKISFRQLHTQGIMRMRLRNENLYLLDKINTAIKTIKQNGELKSVFLKHDMNYPTTQS